MACKSAPPLSCYCADHSKLNKALSCIKWGWLLLHFWNQTLLQAVNVFYASKKYLFFITNKIPSFLCCLMLFYILITGIFKFLEPNRPSTPKMDGFWCLWWFYQSQLTTDITTLLYVYMHALMSLLDSITWYKIQIQHTVSDTTVNTGQVYHL